MSTLDKNNSFATNEQQLEPDFYAHIYRQEEFLEVINNPTGKNEAPQRSIDSMVSTEALKKVRERLALEHGNDLGRAFFSAEIRNKIESHIRRILMKDKKLQVDGMDMREQAKTMIDEIVGLGPIEELMKDDTITEIMINGPKEVYIDKVGEGMIPTDIRFDDDAHVLAIARKMLNLAGAQINQANPICDARLPESRLNIVIPPVARTGTTITIRKYPPVNMTEESMLASGLLTVDMLTSLKLLVRGGANIFVAGGTGAGKTTFIKRLAQEIPDHERTITLEDTEELRLKTLYPQKHIVPLECRFTEKEETNIDLGKLLKSTLRMFPSRVIVGEVRSKEALDLIEILNTGHDGGMSSGHANSAADSITRIVQMILRNGLPLAPNVIGKMVATAFDIIVFVEKQVDGTRVIKEIIEVLDYENDKPVYNTLYEYRVNNVSIENNKIKLIGEHIEGKDCTFSNKLVSKLVSNGVPRNEIDRWVKKGAA